MKGIIKGKMNNTKPILSISILVSNRIDTVEKTMESVKRIMDRIPCELIIVDTVGEEKSDGSLAIAKKYATKPELFSSSSRTKSKLTSYL